MRPAPAPKRPRARPEAAPSEALRLQPPPADAAGPGWHWRALPDPLLDAARQSVAAAVERADGAGCAWDAGLGRFRGAPSALPFLPGLPPPAVDAVDVDAWRPTPDLALAPPTLDEERALDAPAARPVAVPVDDALPDLLDAVDAHMAPALEALAAALRPPQPSELVRTKAVLRVDRQSPAGGGMHCDDADATLVVCLQQAQTGWFSAASPAADDPRRVYVADSWAAQEPGDAVAFAGATPHRFAPVADAADRRVLLVVYYDWARAPCAPATRTALLLLRRQGGLVRSHGSPLPVPNGPAAPVEWGGVEVGCRVLVPPAPEAPPEAPLPAWLHLVADFARDPVSLGTLCELNRAALDAFSGAGAVWGEAGRVGHLEGRQCASLVSFALPSGLPSVLPSPSLEVDELDVGGMLSGLGTVVGPLTGAGAAVGPWLNDDDDDDDDIASMDF